MSFGIGLLGLTTDRFDVVAVGVENEGGVVVRMVMRPQSGSAIVAASGAETSLIKRLDLGSRLGGEGHVQTAHRFLAVSYPEMRPPFNAEPRMRVASGLLGGHFHQKRNLQRRQSLDEERLRTLEVGDRQSDMIQHAVLP